MTGGAWAALAIIGAYMGHVACAAKVSVRRSMAGDYSHSIVAGGFEEMS